MGCCRQVWPDRPHHTTITAAASTTLPASAYSQAALVNNATALDLAQLLPGRWQAFLR